MSTIGEIADWAVRRVDRPDKYGFACEFAKEAVQLATERIPFDELCVKSAEIAIPTTGEYTLSAIDPKISGIISIRATYGTGQSLRLKKSNGRQFDAYPSGLPAGRPSRYCRFAGKLEFHPIPSVNTYTMRLRYWRQHPFSDGDDPPFSSTELLTPERWDALFRWETLFRVLYDLGRPEEAMMLNMTSQLPRQYDNTKVWVKEIGIIPKLWNDLLKTVDMREAIDDDFGINPSLRRYTSIG
jgi:hypothetical protein